MATPIPENGAPFTVDEIVRVTGGELVRLGAESVEGVSTDSRQPLAGKAFVALRGDHFDAHDLVHRAQAEGANVIVVERDVNLEGGAASVVRVDSTLSALGALAAHHRRRWGKRIVAVAGSAGKTSTRGTIACLLRELRPSQVHATVGNLNNQVGVPMVLFGLAPEHEMAVVEIGTNQTGEVPLLTEMVAPDVSVLTLIDLEHSEGLGGLDAIEEEEGAVFSRLTEHGVALGNADDPRVMRQLAACRAGTKVSYGRSGAATYQVVSREPSGTGERVVIRSESRGSLSFRSPLLGWPGALSAAAALSVADCLFDDPIDGAAVTRALRHAGEPGRLTPVPLSDGVLVLDDTYNANPASVKEGIRAARELAKARGGRLWLVLGEMRELGDASPEEHRRMGALAARSGARGLFALGGDARLSAEQARAQGVEAWFFEDAAEAAEELMAHLVQGDVALIKASRGVRAERLVQALVAARGRSE